MSDTIIITIRNYDNYKGRSDIKNNTWFRLSNRFLEDPEFYDFTAQEKLAWIYFLSLASQKNHGTIHVSIHRANKICCLDKSVLTTAIKKLSKLRCIEAPRTRSVRGRYAHVTDSAATLHNTTLHNTTEQNITLDHNTTEPNESVAVEAAKKNEISFKISNEKVIKINSDLINSWTDTFPKEFLDEEIKKARSWILSNEHKAPKKNWGKFLNSWFNRGWDRYRQTLKSNPTKVTIEDLNESLGVL